MAIELAAEVPCAELKALGNLPELKLLGGVDLKAFVDISAGPATDCKLTLNLLLQLAPLLASMACLLKILNVIAKLQEVAKVVTDPPKVIADPSKIVTPAVELVNAIGELSLCMPPLQPFRFALMVKTMLQLVLRFLSCFLGQMESLLQFRASIDLSKADGNPVLRDSLLCAQKNADAAQANVLKSIEPLVPILSMVGVVASIAGLSLTLPDVSSVSAGADLTASIQSIKDAVDAIQKVVDTL